MQRARPGSVAALLSAIPLLAAGPAGADERVTFSACPGGMIYGARAGERPYLAVALDGGSGGSVGLSFQEGVGAPAMTGVRDGAVWSLDLVMPAFGAEAVVAALTRGNQVSFDAAFRPGTGRSLELRAFAVRDTGTRCRP